ncbi:universal stress protein [Microbacterium sp. p3-SID336]|uniref:universal stress protein n=1 Tax=Microbacterium sp. p3-SID336 TaxID=2916212 RepID=UPI0021A5E794|nr:universal stress protein [Microbacterium sp. p3-SID336]MCT1478586.1 universal stress protein [Microbacterium sp. p3-SID336]
MDDITESDRVIVGVDGSRCSAEVLRYAAGLARALGVRLEAVIAWTYPTLAEPYPMPGWSPEEEAAHTLDSTIGVAFGDDPPDDLRRSVVAGPAARTLIHLSETTRMLVVGSRGHGGFTGLLLGSVSMACAQHAQCPVLIYHEPKPREQAS